ncbi:hypothetical protein [Mesonia maritima]|uniref:Uncharacterized membrane protein HdeD (DUF308 family) n=1 Tax=Mesonia maritima TaxID=1793873 RepID=A0ABU1K933_9FLAO|nr:hypothetical protein [Mesonia maritima]MDR6301821.1 uncharacterized membrane protein HdeD (DUF308 family) [Mesonia maritima]
MKLSDRTKKPTPKFFKVLRTIGLTIAGIGGTLVAAPVALPAIVTTIAGYFTVAGGVLSGVSQLTVSDDERALKDEK